MLNKFFGKSLYVVCDVMPDVYCISSQELHLYEGFISSSSRSFKESVKNWFQNWFQNEREEICKHWETSAHVLLDRVFEKCGSFNNEDNKTLIENLNRWQEGFQSVIRRLKFPENFSPSQINVSVGFL